MKRVHAVVIHSGGMDSSLCLALAIKEFGPEHVLSLSFDYGQRHSEELAQAAKICREWDVDHALIPVGCLQEITENALVNPSISIEHLADNPPNTLVIGRNGLMARLGAIHAQHLGASLVFMGVIEVEGENAGYRDCTRAYFDLEQAVLRIDLDDPSFEIRTPIVHMTKKETLELAHELGILDFLLRETITCYQGLPHQGCTECPACTLRNKGIRQFAIEYPEVALPYGI